MALSFFLFCFCVVSIDMLVHVSIRNIQKNDKRTNYKTSDRIEYYSPYNAILFCWIPGYIGIKGIGRADLKAKKRHQPLNLVQTPTRPP